MTIVNVIEEQNLSKYLVITQQKDPSTLITTRVVITDNANNKINLVNIERGIQGDTGPQGPQGIPGQDGIIFEILPIASGGTNNTIFTNDKIIYFDGSKLTSSIYSVDELINSQNAITGVIAGSGLSKIDNNKNITLNTNLGDGLTLSNNTIIVDDTIARKSEISLGTVLPGAVPINKGGTNNTSFFTNTFVYFDGNKLTSFPLDTGRIVTSGSIISIIAGSGLIGGGSATIPGGSVVINIPQSSDIAVLDNSIELTTTGITGTYTKVTTDTKGRVISGVQLNQSDIILALGGYAPWHSGNDGEGSTLDADLLDGYHGSYYRNINNLTGTITTGILPNIIQQGLYSKVTVNSKGLVIDGSNINSQDIYNALGYIPVSKSGDTVQGNLTILGNLDLKDNLPEFGYDNYGLLPDAPRGFSFTYGTTARRTGILAYYPDQQQLKLITNIFGTGVTDLDGSTSDETNYNGEVDGGDASSIYLAGNLVGDQATVLLQHIADDRYVRLVSNQVISGIKSFDNQIFVKKFIFIQNIGGDTPPLYVDGNSRLVTSLNSDLLDDQHGSYYKNAGNLTGILDYTNVRLTSLSGTNKYLPKFDNRSIDPSYTVSDSIVYESGTTIFVEDGSLSVGTTNKISSTNSLSVGQNNNNPLDRSLTVGINNTTSGSNSVALNFGSVTNKANSLAMGKYGTTWIENQLSIGAFEERENNSPFKRIGHGQQSVATIGYYGTPTTFTSMSPQINIPNNKTILYNLSLLFTKFGSSGVASFNFSSGIVKNTAGELVEIKAPTKQEIFNTSQIRDYLYNIKVNSNGSNQNQTLSVTTDPILGNSPEIQNLPNVIKIKPDLTEISGNFFRTFDGNIIIDMHKPITSGWFTQSCNNAYINIKNYNHNMVPGSLVDVTYISGTTHKPSSSSISGSVVVSVIDKNNFIVSDLAYSGFHEGNGTIFVSYNNLVTGNDKIITLSGTLDSSSNTDQITDLYYQSGTFFANDTDGLSQKLSNILPGMVVNIKDDVRDNFANQPPKVVSVANTITLDSNYTGPGPKGVIVELYIPLGAGPQFSDPISVLNNSHRAYFFSENFNRSANISSNILFTTSGIRFDIVGYDTSNVINDPSNSYDLGIIPIDQCIEGVNQINSGNLYLVQKRSYDCLYERENAVFNPYTVKYTHSKSINDISTLDFVADEEISFLNNYNPYVKFLTATNSFSGTLTSGTNLITNCNPIQNNNLVTGLLLSATTPEFYYTGIITDINVSTLTMSNTFSGVATSIDTLIIYSGQKPLDSQYDKISVTLNGSGYIAQRSFISPDTGIYFTGLAKIYSNYGYAIITSNAVGMNGRPSKANIATNELVYMDFKSNNRGIIPANGNYTTSGTYIPNSFKVVSKHLMPDSGIYCSGHVFTTLDRDHGYLPPSQIQHASQQIPLFFDLYSTYISLVGTGNDGSFQLSSYSNNTNRNPKNNILSIVNVTGHSILVNDDKYQLLKEIDKSSLYNDYSLDYFKKILYDFSPGIRSCCLRVSSLKAQQYFEINDKIIINRSNNINNLGSVNSVNLNNVQFKVSGFVDSYMILQLIDNRSSIVSGILDNNNFIGSSGYIQYIGYQDGYVTSPINNFYFNSYGSGSEFWRRDTRGIYIQPPLTGFFNIYSSEKLCNSGTLCVHISGISDLSDLNTNQSLFFDFIDTSPVLTGLFSIYDKITPNIITLNIPYEVTDPKYVNNSGLVYIIDGLENIKTNKNPNKNNAFITSSSSNNIDIGTTLSSFNTYNNRWKHGVFLKNSGIIKPTGYISTPISVNHDGSSNSMDTNTNVIVSSLEDLSFSVWYSGTQTSDYVNTQPNLSANPNVILADINSPLNFMIKVLGGAGRWSEDIDQCAPMVSVLGLKNYTITDKTFNFDNQEWNIKITSNAPSKVVSSKNLKFIVNDETARVVKDRTLTTTMPFTVSNIQQIEYPIVDVAGASWKFFVDIYGGVPPYTISMPVSSQDADISVFNAYGVNLSQFANLPNYYTFMIKGNGLYPETGIYNTNIIVTDNFNRTTTGIVKFTVSDAYVGYQPKIRLQQTGLIINKTNAGNNNYISFIIPCRNTPPQGSTNIQLLNNQTLSLSEITSSYYYDLDAYRYSAKVNTTNSNIGLYNILVTGSIIQPTGTDNTTSTIAFGTGVSVDVYNTIGIDTYKIVQPLKFDVDSVWDLSLDIIDGANYISSSSTRQLKMYLGNIPNNGRYANTPYQYRTNYKYIADLVPRQEASFTGIPDQFSVNSLSTGLYDLYYYLEDYTSYNTGILTIALMSGIDLINFHDKKYATINNGFDFNFDIEGYSYKLIEQTSGGPPAITSDDSSKNDILISLTKTYSKYDPHIKVWEYFYSGAPITEKWDAEIDIVDSNQLNLLDIKVKGLSDDKIYVAGKFDSVETDNVIIVENPFKIIDVFPASADEKREEGEDWEIKFSTIGGLESPFYPPLIKLINTPNNTCTGYNPVDTANIALCVSPPEWKPSTKKWDFKFKGPELCIVGTYNVIIEAYDVLTGSVNGGPLQIIEQKGFAISGAPIIYEENKIAHPAPTVEELKDTKTLYPYCQDYAGYIRYDSAVRDVCPRPTGISGVFVWGDFPAGITFSNSRLPYTAPYNDLTGGQINFQGMPIEFAGGGSYPYTGYVNAIDATSKSGSPKQIIFEDGSRPMEPSPTDITIYFDKPGYHYTPFTGTKIIENTIQTVVRPPPVPFSMQCLSMLPHNKCVYYSGSYKDADAVGGNSNFFSITLQHPKLHEINNGTRIYLNFTGLLQDGAPASLLDGVYAKDSDINNQEAIIVTGYNPNNTVTNLPITGGVKILNLDNNFKNKSLESIVNTDYFHTASSPLGSVYRMYGTPGYGGSDVTGIMGDAQFGVVDDALGIYGKIKPVAYTSVTGYFPSTDDDTVISEKNVDFHIITDEEKFINPYIIELKNCYETTYIRVSGVVIPKFYIDFTDPPPGTNNDQSPRYYTIPTNAIAIGMRSSYGDTIDKRQYPFLANGRTISDLDCIVKDEINNIIKVNPTVIVLPTEGDYSANIQMNDDDKSSVYSVLVQHTNTEEFPTYKQNQIPSASSIAYWIHSKTGEFPPVYPIDNFKLIYPTGKLIEKQFTFIGGKYPINIPGKFYKDYIPSVTGYIQTDRKNVYSGVYSHRMGIDAGSPSDSDNNLILTFQDIDGNNSPADGDALYVEFLSFKDNVSFSPSGTGLIVDSAYSLVSVISGFMPYNTSEKTGIFIAKDLYQIYTDAQNSTNLNIRYNNTVKNNNYLIINTGIDLIDSLDATRSLLGNLLQRSDFNDLVQDTIRISGIDTSTRIATISGMNENYYSNLLLPSLNGTGLCYLRNTIFDENLSFAQKPNDSGNFFGITTYTLTGILYSPFNEYIYRTITCENTGLFSNYASADMNARRYGKDFDLIVTSPLIITPYLDEAESLNSDPKLWKFGFSVTGGYIPRSEEFLEVEIDDLIHTFNRTDTIYQSGIHITINSRPGISWTGNTFVLKVFDSIGIASGTFNIP